MFSSTDGLLITTLTSALSGGQTVPYCRKTLLINAGKNSNVGNRFSGLPADGNADGALVFVFKHYHGSTLHRQFALLLPTPACKIIFVIRQNIIRSVSGGQ